jgi:hypothetical protein
MIYKIKRNVEIVGMFVTLKRYTGAVVVVIIW